ncbi:unnamed protein product, partial [Adineta steineri]
AGSVYYWAGQLVSPRHGPLASFQGIHSVKFSWLFIIDNWQIYSINSRITTTAF